MHSRSSRWARDVPDRARVSAIPAAIFGFVEGYAALIVVGFFLGIAGSSFAVGVPFVAGWYPKERQGFALGVYGMGNIGTAVAAFSAPAIVDWFGREALGIVAAILLVATAVVFYSMAEDPPRGPAVDYGAVLARAGSCGASRSSTSSPSAASSRWPCSYRSCSATGSTSR